MIEHQPQPEAFVHRRLACGVEFAAEPLPDRKTVALAFRMLCGLADEAPELTGINAITCDLLSKGTENYSGRAFADAFDQIGAQWHAAAGRQSVAVRVLCLPEFVERSIGLVSEMLRRPAFAPEACNVAVDLAQQDLRQLDDHPIELLRTIIQRLTLGPILGRHVGGSTESLPLITPDAIRAHWQRGYHAGRLQVIASGAIDPAAIERQLVEVFDGFGAAALTGRDVVEHEPEPVNEHRDKQLEQEYLWLSLPGLPKGHPEFAVEQLLVGILSGGMSGRLFTEVREKQGLVYWVGARAEQLRGKGYIRVGAGTTPQRCQQTLETLLRELRRVGSDVTEDEVERARTGLIAQYETENDLTRARAALLSDDLFHFGAPIGLQERLDALRAVSVDDVADYARRLQLDRLCVATLGPVALDLAAVDTG